MSDLQELIRNARQEIRKASGLLTQEEQIEDERKAAQVTGFNEALSTAAARQ
jgi:hypothetical protein